MPRFTHLIIIPNNTNVTFVLLKSLTHKDCLHEQHLEILPLLFFSVFFILFENFSISNSTVQKSWVTSYFVVFCYQRARLSCNFWVVLNNGFPGFLKVFLIFSLVTGCFLINFFHFISCTWPFFFSFFVKPHSIIQKKKSSLEKVPQLKE